MSTPYRKGQIVQIIDETHQWFPALLVVSGLFNWGVLAYCVIPTNGPEPNGQAYIRVKYEQVELVGHAVIDTPPTDDEEMGEV